MIVGLPPLQMSLQMGSLPGGGPGAPSQSGHAAADRQRSPLDKGRVHSSGEAQPLQRFPEGWLCSRPDDVLDPHEPASSVALLDLPIHQTSCHFPLPHFPPAPTCLDPGPKMSGEGVEIGSEAIAGEEGQAAGSQLLAQAVNEQLSRALGARTQQQHWNACGERIDGHPEPQDLGMAAQPRAQFIELQMGKGELTEGAFMQALSMRSSA
jgi:hypothetical protein